MPGYLAGGKAPPHGPYSYLSVYEKSVCDQIQMIGRYYRNQGSEGKDPELMGECKQRKWTISAILQEGEFYCNVSQLRLSNSDVCLEALY